MCNLISLLKYQIQIPEAALQSIPPCHFSATCDRQLIRLLSRHGKILHRYQLWSIKLPGRLLDVLNYQVVQPIYLLFLMLPLLLVSLRPLPSRWRRTH